MTHRSLLLTSFVLGGILVNGCNCGNEDLGRLAEAHIVIAYEDQKSPDLERLDIAFGATEIGTTARRDFVIQNEGGKDLEVGDVRIASHPDCPSPSSAFRVDAPALTDSAMRSVVVPGRTSETDTPKEETVTVSFNPTDGLPACAAVEVHSNDEDYPVRVALFTGQGNAAQLCATVLDVDFGEVLIGDTATDTFHLESCGTRPITLVDMTLNEWFPPFEAALPAFPLTLQPGESLDLPVSFSPEQALAYTHAAARAGSILVISDELVYTLSLSGIGVRPPSCNVSVNPSLIQFGNVIETQTSTQPLIVRNIGDLDCNITDVSIVAPAGNFSLQNFAPSAPAVLAPNDQLTVDVVFAPTAANGAENGIIEVHSDDLINPVIEVPIEASSIDLQPCALTAVPTAVNFGLQALGGTYQQQLVLTNVGTEQCLVKDIVLSNGADSYTVEAPIFPILGAPVGPGDTLTANVFFTPQTSGLAPGMIDVEYKEFGFGNPDQTLQVPVNGEGLSPNICVVPDALDFGSVSVGNVSEQSFSIQNCGPVDLEIRGLTFTPGTHPNYIFPNAPAVPFTLAPGDAQPVAVQAAPTNQGVSLAGLAMYGAVDVLSADENNPAAKVNLTANAGVCAAGLSCTPLDVNFGPVDFGLELLRSVSCFNPGSATINTAATIDAPFEIVSGPSTVAPFTSAVFVLRYEPSSLGVQTGNFYPGANDCEGNPIAISLAGQGQDGILPACPSPTVFQPEVVWHWEGDGALPNSKQVWVTPLITRLEDTTGDDLVTREDMPRVVFISFDSADSSLILSGDIDSVNDPVPGVLRAVDGANGTEVWTNTEVTLNSSVTPVAADINADGYVEIIAQKHVLLEGYSDFENGPKIKGKFSRGNLVAFTHDGQLLWESEQWTRNSEEIEDTGGLAVADMDGDGLAEIAVGDHVFDHNGNLKFKGGTGTGSAGHGPISGFANMDDDPELELVCAGSVYNHDGSALFARESTDIIVGTRPMDGVFAVGDLDQDGYNEIVLNNGQLQVLNGQTGATIAGPITPPIRMSDGDECEPPADPESDEDCNPIPTNPAIMDVDGDGQLDIAFANQNIILAYDRNLNEIWRKPISDQTGASGPIGFDFENDGMVNVLYSDEGTVWVFDELGQPIYDANRVSVTMMETASIGDANLDGHANVVVGSNEPMLGTADGLDMWQNTTISWPHSRPMWNQHAYVEDLIGELGTPVLQSNAMKSLDGWRISRPACY